MYNGEAVPRKDVDAPLRRRLGDLVASYDAVLLDAYGVLNDHQGALPGAAALIAALDRGGPGYFVVTNDASRLPTTLAARFASMGLPIAAERIITSGSILERWYAEHGLHGARTIVLGPPDSARYVERAGGVVVANGREAEVDVVVVADDAGFEFLPGVEAALSAVVRLCERGAPPRLVLPNPDLIYPAGVGFGFTAGAAALLIEAGLERRLGAGAPRFERLGKPAAYLFDEAVRRAGSRRLLMIGDQLETDVAGALGAGLDAALLETGVGRWRPGAAVTPTYVVDALD